MANNSSSGGNGGIGFVGLLTIVLIVLKLTNVIDWPWWWVWSPIWITAAVVCTILAAGTAGIVAYHQFWKRK